MLQKVDLAEKTYLRCDGFPVEAASCPKRSDGEGRGESPRPVKNCYGEYMGRIQNGFVGHRVWGSVVVKVA